VHKSYGGPIAEISVRKTEIFGAAAYEAYTTLDIETTGVQPRVLQIYGSCHGTGTSKLRSLAVYKAISESLERWAWEDSYKKANLNKLLRFDLDPSSTGFAAYPGLLSTAARKKAFSEAVERFSVAAWWERKLGHESLDFGDNEVRGIRILNPWPKQEVVILWSRVADLVTYGFAASQSLGAAINRAKVELCRNLDVLDQYAALESEQKVPTSLLERRLLYFARETGAKDFRKRLLKTGNGMDAPDLLVDRAVPGAWNKYTHVWRCLFDNATLSREKEEDYFLF
jgi:hypothetical protein